LDIFVKPVSARAQLATLAQREHYQVGKARHRRYEGDDEDCVDAQGFHAQNTHRLPP
jgi:hypothetical protein